MSVSARIEDTLTSALAHAQSDLHPPGLAAAMRHAVFPGGARVRPSLCIAVAQACGDDAPHLANGAAAAIELLHCASLVHDDLPCFDDAATRRSVPSVHAAFGAPLAVLAGDALIVLAFEELVGATPAPAQRVIAIHRILTRSVGMPGGICAGQAWESEPTVPPELYRCAKTGALFVAATMSGALAAGADPAIWRPLGERLGEAYQVADDLLDAVTAAEDSTKPVGRDVALGRPSAIAELGIQGAVRKLEELIAAAVDAVPECRGATALRSLVVTQAKRLAPKRFLNSAAA